MADNTIQLKGEALNKERAAGGIISPGQLVELASSDKYIRHNTAAVVHSSSFAVEDSLQGKTVSQDYALDDRVQVNVQRKGNEVMARLSPDLGGTPVVIGDFLESNGDGDLRLLTATQPVGVAIEAVDLTQTGDVSAFIKIEIV